MDRNIYAKDILKALRDFPVVALIGARQVGKTTIARLVKSKYHFDLENPRDLAKFENPQLLLENLSGVVVIDEIQRKPELFTLLRFLVDRPKNKTRFLVSGSASRELIRQASETLAGRIYYTPVYGFDLSEIKKTDWKRLWERGSFPMSFLAKAANKSYAWREQYITTFLEKDIPQLGITIPAYTLRRFWIMISHYHGGLLNYAELAHSFGISDMTVRKYIDILKNTFMLNVLQPWHENTGKRLTKQPKIYLSDTGIFHTLQFIEKFSQLQAHPKIGASFEGFVINQIISMQRKELVNYFFYRTHQGTELDLFWMKGGKRWGVEVKYSDAPTLTKSMQIAMNDLKLEKIWVVYPGEDRYMIHKKIEVLPVSQLNELMQK
ncbi:MAG TPA: ATP-binding protein [Leptospiraceae bacterium]|nr:ATP-binding protein [Leptospiraceae bacterium]HMW07133.1 ATP-binding protein [Leptospiraceae bacterium]HMX31807.1 ATP-binding protein [Leptospiraceae bacterium]HMY32550.1 ATP-binding protein [Leptospiraceae bacterium]HMZ63916.1 ATP-binding protein [Leptospiraceae bacterium]